MVAENSVTAGSIAADQQQPEPQPVLVGPTTADEFNTIGERLIPKGCFRMEDIRFEFDSSFIRPEAKDDMPALADLIDRHTLSVPGPPVEKTPPPLTIFGHGDPVGNDDYNKQLSGRRALAFYAMLIRDENIWEKLFTQPFGGDKWGNRQIQTMLGAVGHSPGPIDGVMGAQSTDAVKAFQSEKGLAVDGVVGPETRKALYRAYMDVLCGPRLELDKEKNFLARHKDGDGLKGDVQGCSEFNPVLLFSQEENARFEEASEKTERNQENTPNRRVMVLLFAPGRRVKPDLWPCPRVKDGVAACKKRFFPDAEKRRGFQDKRREFEKTKDTFACRFYQIITDDSPCERSLPILRIRLFDRRAVPLPNAPFIVPNATPPLVGRVREDAFITMRNLKVPTTVKVKWSRPQPEDGPDSPLPALTDEFEFELDVAVDIPEDKPEDTSLTRLTNMGYVRGPSRVDDIREFQRDYKPRFPDIEIDGTLNAVTQKAIKEAHDTCELALKGQR